MAGIFASHAAPISERYCRVSGEVQCSGAENLSNSLAQERTVWTCVIDPRYIRKYEEGAPLVVTVIEEYDTAYVTSFTRVDQRRAPTAPSE